DGSSDVCSSDLSRIAAISWAVWPSFFASLRRCLVSLAVDLACFAVGASSPKIAPHREMISLLPTTAAARPAMVMEIFTSTFPMGGVLQAVTTGVGGTGQKVPAF